MQDFINSIRAEFKGDISFDEASLEKYSHDASLLTVKPSLVVFPKDAKDIGVLVRAVEAANKQGKSYSLTARSAGTDMTGGPLSESIVVDFTRYFNQVKEVRPEYAITQPGVYYRDFDTFTLAKNRILPCYPASRDLCTVGGMVSNNSGGEKNLNYGKTEQYVMELKMVLRDGNEYSFKALTLAELEEKKKLETLEGEVYRNISKLIDGNYEKIMAAKPAVSKNSAGYYLWNVLDKEKGVFDITKLLVGSQGTFGLVTEIKFKLVKPKTHSQMLLVFMTSMKGLGDLTNHILQFKPESLESYDDHTFKLAVKLFPAMLKKMKGNAIMLGFRFIPEFWSVVTGGIPKLVLMAEFTADTDTEAHELAVKAEASVREFGYKTKVTSSPEEIGKYWTIRRESFKMLREHVKHMRTAPFIDDFVVLPEKLPEFLPKLYSILDGYNITYTIAGHVGDGNFHIIPLMDMSLPESKKAIVELMDKVNDLVIEYKGSITGEHNDGIIRTPYLEKMFGSEIYKLFVETKRVFDPENMFNPGKKVGGSWDYAVEHFDTRKL